MTNKVKILGNYLLYAALLFTGCGPKDNIPSDESAQYPADQNVYVAGTQNVQSNTVARLWKNGAIQNLAGSSGSALRSSTTDSICGSIAKSVFVSGNDVYVAGYDVFWNGFYAYSKARLWKNGVSQNLDANTFSDEATAVFVSDSNVYVAGFETPPLGGCTLKVWKNGVVQIFTQDINVVEVNSLFVSGGDVYVAGGIGSGNGTNAKLWKNGILQNIEISANHSDAYSVFVSGSDVYVAGYDQNAEGNATYARLWKNGVAQNLAGGAAFSVYVSGSDVYVAGKSDSAKLWKNGIVQSIADDSKAMLYYSVYVSGNDVYLAGYVDATDEIYSNGLEVHHMQATLWKNGKILNLDIDKNSDSQAYSIFVK